MWLGKYELVGWVGGTARETLHIQKYCCSAWLLSLVQSGEKGPEAAGVAKAMIQ